MSKKTRLDQKLVHLGMADSRQKARSMILAGQINVNSIPATKPGTMVKAEDRIQKKGPDMPYVSRGGLKLEAALAKWRPDIRGFFCMDVGASTGGFTDCLLKHGARTVYAVDVGYGQLAWPLRSNPGVKILERTNIRYLPKDKIPDSIDLITIDTSFISLKIVVPAAALFLKPNGIVFALIKPQFEVGKGRVGKGGVVKDPALHRSVLANLSNYFADSGWTVHGTLPSPIMGPKGNREFFIYLQSK